MCQNKRKRKKVYISEEMEREFIVVVRNMIKECIVFPTADSGTDFSLLLCANDKEHTPIGASDGFFFLMDSKLVYNRFCSHWNDLIKLLAYQPSVPNQKIFYRKLFYQNVLVRGALYSQPGCVKKFL